MQIKRISIFGIVSEGMTSSFNSKQSQNLDLSFKADLDFGELFGRENPISRLNNTRMVYRLTVLGAPVVQWVKRWPTDLAVESSSPARIFSIVNGVPLHSLSLSSAHRPDKTEIMLKRT